MAAVETLPPSAARERILETAFRLFYAKGLRAVGVDTIIAESGVAKATFYRHFPAKDDLVVAYRRRWTGSGPASCTPRPRQQDQIPPTSWWACSTRSPRPPGRAHPATRAPAACGEAGAEQPERLARSLALLLDGALSSGALDANPEAAEAARAAVALLVQEAVGR
jgi:AcrR family transcriptional regulator